MSCSGLPIECETWEEACSCATSIAETHGFVLRETTGPEHEGPLRIPKVPWPLSAEGWVSPKIVLRYSDVSDRIRLVVQVFPAEESCYAFQGDVERLEVDGSITRVLGACGWRKDACYFAEDVQHMLSRLLDYDPSGRVLARVKSWEGEEDRGVVEFFGCTAKLDRADVEPRARGEVREGVMLRVRPAWVYEKRITRRGYAGGERVCRAYDAVLADRSAVDFSYIFWKSSSAVLPGRVARNITTIHLDSFIGWFRNGLFSIISLNSAEVRTMTFT